MCKGPHGQAMQSWEDHYPEIFGDVYFYYPPQKIVCFWNCVGPFIEQRARALECSQHLSDVLCALPTIVACILLQFDACLKVIPSVIHSGPRQGGPCYFTSSVASASDQHLRCAAVLGCGKRVGDLTSRNRFTLLLGLLCVHGISGFEGDMAKVIDDLKDLVWCSHVVFPGWSAALVGRTRQFSAPRSSCPRRPAAYQRC